jgi:hypothetical protein
LPNKTEEQRERAEAKSERLQKVAEEGRVAMAEYRAAALAMRQKTERLRALRLASEPESATGPLAAAAPRGSRIVARKAPKSPPKQLKKRAKAQ